MEEKHFKHDGFDLLYYYAPCDCRKFAVLFHGYSFESKVWEQVGLVKAMNAAGYNVIAIDVPGFPKSRNRFKIDDSDFIELLYSLIREKASASVVMLGSSASSRNAVNFAKSHSNAIKAMILVGPVYLPQDVLKTFNFKILGIWGSKDEISPPEAGAKLLKNAKNSEYKVIDGASHACYLSNPEEFNRIIVEFLASVE
ncbi:MAG: alpha/beta hydrolase [Candidatus Micrarchaeaceae archaeon]